MTLSEAMDLLRPAVRLTPRACWADLGAGDGIFTRALASILHDRQPILYAVDQHIDALADIAQQHPQATIHTVAADVRAWHWPDTSFDGVLLANILHFLPDPATLLLQVRQHLAPHGTTVVLEYDRAKASTWVPFPLPPAQLQALLHNAGFRHADIIARRPSRYQGNLYMVHATI